MRTLFPIFIFMTFSPFLQAQCNQVSGVTAQYVGDSAAIQWDSLPLNYHYELRCKNPDSANWGYIFSTTNPFMLHHLLFSVMEVQVAVFCTTGYLGYCASLVFKKQAPTQVGHKLDGATSLAYPNPFHDVVYFAFNKTYSLRDMVGRQMMAGTDHQPSVAGLPNGVYLFFADNQAPRRVVKE
jgi:hypothetical protein